MTKEKIKQVMDACYQAKRVRDMMPKLPNEVTPTHIHYLDVITKLELDGADGAVMLDMNDLTEHALVTARGEGGLQLRFALEKAGSVVIVERSGAAAQSCGDTLPVKRYDGATVGLPERWRLTEKPKNMMTLDYARLSYDGVSYTELLPVPCIKERLYRERYEGRLWMKYEFNAEYLPQDLTCVVEPMRGLGVSVGGNELSADGDWWYDRTFKCYPIGNSAQPGRTEIILTADIRRVSEKLCLRTVILPLPSSVTQYCCLI